MYSEISLPQRVIEYLDDLNYPVRVLNGNAYGFVPPASWRGAARANRTSLTRCENEGLTIVSWGVDALSYSPYQHMEVSPGEFYTDGGERPANREWIVPAAEPNDENSFATSNGIIWARVGTRTVWFTMALDSIPDWDNVNLDYLFGRPINSAMDSQRQTTEDQTRRNRARDRFIELAGRANQRQRETLTAQLNSHESQLREYERYHQHTMAEIRNTRMALAAFTGQDEEARRNLHNQWEALADHPKLEDISVDQGALTFMTTGLDLTNPHTGESVYLGKFQITIPMNTNRDIRIQNLDNTKRPADSSYMRHHPHVDDGGPCFGDVHSLISTMRSNGEVAGLLEIMIQYLETFNPDDSWGVYGQLWFEGDESVGLEDE